MSYLLAFPPKWGREEHLSSHFSLFTPSGHALTRCQGHESWQEETVNFIVHCPKYEQERRQLLVNLGKFKVTFALRDTLQNNFGEKHLFSVLHFADGPCALVLQPDVNRPILSVSSSEDGSY